MRAQDHQRIVRDIQERHAAEVRRLEKALQSVTEDRDHWEPEAKRSADDYRQAVGEMQEMDRQMNAAGASH